MTPEIEEAVTALLVAHQRRDVGSCLCGWNELGRSHAQHQMLMLRGARLLFDRNGGKDG